MMDLAAEQDRAIEAERDRVQRVSRARAALGGFTPQDIFAMVLLVLALIAGFAGGAFFGLGVGFLVLSGEMLLIAILVGLS